jgi:potassium-transporting ATPase KdpC subunit
MLTHFRRSAISIVVFTVFFGFVYAFAGTGVAQLFFRHQADGSITANGSTLIGQPWNNGKSIDPMWFNGRPDADNPLVLNGAPGGSGSSNLGPRSQTLVNDVQAMITEWHKVGVNPTPDLVTTSGSGLDPDISPLDAQVQIPMVAKARHLSQAALRTLVAEHTNSAQFGFLGSSYINVLELNEALAALASSHH